MARSQVLLLDDGELDDVQRILQEIGVNYGRVRGGAIVPNTPPPSRLFVTTPRRMAAVKLPEPGSPDAAGLVRIVVVNEDSPTLRARLRTVGFDYLVRRPVHPEALRLLLLRCLYTGEERRVEPRVPVGLEVSYRAGLLPRRATLADLSTRGCRLLSRWALEPGKRISLSIPSPGDAPGSFHVKGRVLRIRLDERLGPDGPYSAAISFESVGSEAHAALDQLLRERARGPATLAREDEAPEEAPHPRELDAPETRARSLAHGVDVPVHVTLEAPEATSRREPAAPQRPQPPASPPAPPHPPAAAVPAEPGAPSRPEPGGPPPDASRPSRLHPPAVAPRTGPDATPARRRSEPARPAVPGEAQASTPPLQPEPRPTRSRADAEGRPASPRLDAEAGLPSPHPQPGVNLPTPRPERQAAPAPAAPPEKPAPAPAAPPEKPAPAPAAPPEAEPEPPSTAFPGDRRHGRRGAYPRRVPAFGDRAMRVLVARDLSVGGMRVEQDSGVHLGDRLHLAIYGSADEEPFLVWATVARDEGGQGLVLVFDQVHPVIEQQLEKVVAGLPAVESLHDDEARAMGTVVTEILEQ